MLPVNELFLEISEGTLFTDLLDNFFIIMITCTTLMKHHHECCMVGKCDNDRE